MFMNRRNVVTTFAACLTLFTAWDAHADTPITLACTNGPGGICIHGDNNTAGGMGVRGSASGSSSYGVYGSGDSTTAIGVYGYNSSSTGVNFGVYGQSDSTNGAAAGVYGLGNTGGAFTGATTGVYGNCTNGGCKAGYFDGSVYVSADLSVTGTITCGAGCNSDKRLKQRIEPLTGAVDKLLQLKGVTYEWKNPEEHGNRTGTQMGLIAQDVENVFPQWVRETEKGFKNVDVDARTMTALTVESVRVLKAENEELRKRIEMLESGRRPVAAGLNVNGLGFGLGGMALAGALIVSRRRREKVRP